jgi:hypothetical protein
MFKSFKISYSFVLLSVLFVLFTSCEKEEELQYSEINISSMKDTKVVITIPKVVGESDVAQKINGVLEQFVTSALQTDANEVSTMSLNTSITNFNKAYKTFNKQVEQITFEALPAWEAIIEGEKIYEDESLVSFSMSSNINTGAAKSITKITFLNFDKTTGKNLSFKNLISDHIAFNSVLEKYLVQELMSNTKYTIKEFKTEGRLRNPDELSFNDNGIIALYRTNLNDFIEIAVPFSQIETYLNY